MKVDSVLERIKLWIDRGVAQQITLHISEEGAVKIERMTKIKDQDQLNKECVEPQWHEIA